jgi:16S rRNA (cytosine1402-N4)-methyltransferase
MNLPQSGHKRRIRYSGTHPRQFHEKYKELQPERYSNDIKKIIERGQTPAGMHRPICVDEVIKFLAPQPGNTGLDATLGYGGHAQVILERILPGGRLFGIDVDPVELPLTEARLRNCGYDENVLVVRRLNFAGASRLLAEAGEGFDFVLADLGVSSMQIDNPARGFTFKSDGPLDLRLNPNKGRPASALLASTDENSLAGIFLENSDEPHAYAIARSIKAQKEPVATTMCLAEIIKKTLETEIRGVSATGRQEETKKTQQRIFQALRIAVNDEFGVLDLFLEQLQLFLKPGGRVVIMSFHSGEDRRVKKSFQAGFRNGIYKSIAPDPIRPSPEERHGNPRSASAKLRWAVRAG